MKTIHLLNNLWEKAQKGNTKEFWKSIDPEVKNEIYFEEEMLMVDLVGLTIEDYIIDHNDTYGDEDPFYGDLNELINDFKIYLNITIPEYLECGDYGFEYFDGDPNEMWTVFKMVVERTTNYTIK